jgi:hypothetical protein
MIGELRQMVPRFPLWVVLVSLGLGTGASGTLLGLAAASTVTAASTVNVCGTSAPVVPGSTGSCRETFASPFGTQPVSVTLSISTVSSSGEGQPGSGVGTEALLDGTTSGMQVQIIDDSTGKLFLVGRVACYQSASTTLPASYPDAAYCSSDQADLPVATVGAGGSQTFTVRWLLPFQAGNPYQGGSASVTLQPTFTAVPAQRRASSTPPPTPRPTGGVHGRSTTSPTPPVSAASPGKHHRVLAASTTTSTPTTGAQLPLVLSRILILAGMGLVLTGLLLWRRRRYFGRG